MKWLFQTPANKRHVTLFKTRRNVATVRLPRGENEKAMTSTLGFLQRFPESPLLNGLLANTYFLSGQPEKGIEYARKAQRTDNATGETYRNLVLVT
jgi:predicted Zn-dependent protease